MFQFLPSNRRNWLNYFELLPLNLFHKDNFYGLLLGIFM